MSEGALVSERRCSNDSLDDLRKEWSGSGGLREMKSRVGGGTDGEIEKSISY